MAVQATPQRDDAQPTPGSANSTANVAARTGVASAEAALAPPQPEQRIQQAPVEQPEPANAPKPATALQGPGEGVNPPPTGAVGPVPSDAALPASFAPGFAPTPWFGLPRPIEPAAARQSARAVHENPIAPAAQKPPAAPTRIDPSARLTSTLAPHLLAQRVEDTVPRTTAPEPPAASAPSVTGTGPEQSAPVPRDTATPSGPAGSAAKMAGLGATAANQAIPATGQVPIGIPAPFQAGDAFPGLRESLAVLTSAAPAAARQTLNTVPQPNAVLSATLLLFLAAVRGGDIRGWMGDRTQRALEAAGRGELVGRIAAELGAARQAGEPPAGDWRPTMIPLYNDGELSAIRLSVPQRDDGGGQEDDGDSDDDQRFVIDLDLSRLGPTQLEGRLNAGRLSLTMRTRAPLEIGMRQEMAGILTAACEGIGLTGAMTFQSGTDHWVDVAAARQRQRTATG